MLFAGNKYLLLKRITVYRVFYSPPPPSIEQKWFEMVVMLTLYTETSSLRTLKRNAQKPQRNCMFMNSALVPSFLYRAPAQDFMAKLADATP